jgi:hypothetical protein
VKVLTEWGKDRKGPAWKAVETQTRSKDWRVRTVALEACANIRIWDPVFDALLDKVTYVRVAAHVQLRGLDASRQKKTVPRVCLLLDDDEPMVRAATCGTLAAIAKNSDGAERIASMLTDKDSRVPGAV